VDVIKGAAKAGAARARNGIPPNKIARNYKKNPKRTVKKNIVLARNRNDLAEATLQRKQEAKLLSKFP
jgi:hypothetical protein